MAKKTLLHNSRCSKSREAFNYLKDNNIDFEIKEYLKDPLKLDEIQDIAKKLNLSPNEFIRSKESVYKENNLKDKSSTELFIAMESFPVLIERPILIVGDKAVIGRPLDNVKKLLNG